MKFRVQIFLSIEVTIRCTTVFGIPTSSAISLTFKRQSWSRTILITTIFSFLTLKRYLFLIASFPWRSYAWKLGLLIKQLFYMLSSTSLVSKAVFFKFHTKFNCITLLSTFSSAFSSVMRVKNKVTLLYRSKGSIEKSSTV